MNLGPQSLSKNCVLYKGKYGNITPVKMDNEELKEVDKFTYLGSVVAIKGNCLPDIKNRLSNKAAGAMNKLENLLPQFKKKYSCERCSCNV